MRDLVLVDCALFDAGASRVGFGTPHGVELLGRAVPPRSRNRR